MSKKDIYFNVGKKDKNMQLLALKRNTLSELYVLE